MAQPATKGSARVPKRIRSKRKRALKRRFLLSRREMGAIGAGHRDPPPGFEMAMFRTFTQEG